ncbi:MAG TPA: ABC transporter ATP-binding protein [Tepidisphaeraceae bacterium]|jgi:ABC-2 type transport system ATP-binding protein|nr:ABC transporter ATP-binding protein [Tepidisphaeraceae bacterium]
MSEEPVIEMRGVAKSFGRTAVLRGLDLTVPPAQTFAFLGRNGAGKTTTIRMLLGLLKPDAGQVRVLGLDPQKDPLEIRRRVGYVAEDQEMFGWMRVGQLLSFVAPFYPTWDAAWAKQLSDRFELPLKTRVKHLSKGQGVRVALLLALAHRPELVILDDPTLGLDPIMRKEFLRDLVTYLQGERVSVFFSSHLLYEIEPVADSVVILDHGRVLRQAQTEELRAKVKRLVAPAEAEEVLGGLPGILDITRRGRQVTVVLEDIESARPALAAAGVTVQEIDLNLDEIFEAYVIGRRKVDQNAQPPLERVA